MKRTVLYVDDEADNRVVFQATLEDRFQVLTAANAEEVLDILGQTNVPVVVADQRMPGCTGVELFGILRTKHPHVKRVLLTAYTEPRAMIDAINQGQVFYFLNKPWDRTTLEPVLVRAIEAYDLSVTLEEQSLLLARQNAELRATQLRLEQASRSKSEFLANMSHEIRTPMTAILGFANLLRENLAAPEDLEAIDTIQRNGEYLLEIINDILDLSKIEAGRLEIEQHPCSPREIVTGVAQLMRLRCDAKRLSLEVAIDADVPELIASDALRLRQVLINLVGNAIKFTERGAVRIAVHRVSGENRGGALQFDVTDTGIGIRPEQMEALFQPFSQVDGSVTRRHGGTGLGLAISRRLAQMLGGDIAVRSVPGQGSTFSLNVAAKPHALAKNECPAAEVRTESDGPGVYGGSDGVEENGMTSGLRGARVLLAEDGPDNQRLISCLLRGAGAELTIVENGLEAVSEVARAGADGRPYDLLLMDMQMPVLDGYRATLDLRRTGFDRPIIAVTAHAMSGDRQKCLDAGCDDVVTKPFDRVTLLRAIAQRLSLAVSR